MRKSTHREKKRFGCLKVAIIRLIEKASAQPLALEDPILGQSQSDGENSSIAPSDLSG